MPFISSGLLNYGFFIELFIITTLALEPTEISDKLAHSYPQALNQGSDLREFVGTSAVVGALLLILTLAHSTGSGHIFSRTFYVQLP